jgi:hypothetical protein
MPVHGVYFRDLFPAFVLGGAGMGLSFVPVTIASLTGVQRADAGVASGLINTSRQIGGAVGLAAVSAIAAAATHGSSAASVNHGLQTGLYALLGLLLFGAALVATLVRPPRVAAAPEAVVLDEAA